MSELATYDILPDALKIVRQSLLATLVPLAPDGRAFWGVGGSIKELPRIIVQMTGSGKLIKYVGMPLGWQGEIAVRVYAATLDDAEQLLRVITAELLAAYQVTSEIDESLWDMGLRSIKPLPSLNGPTTAVAGIAYQCRVEAHVGA